MRNSKIKYIIAGIFTLALVSLPAILYLSNKQQEIRTKASASTSLYFAPTASSSSPLQVNVGDPIKFDIMINPGTNLPSVVTLDIRFDTSKIQATPTSFMVNSSSFPTTLEGPILTDKSLNISLSIGPDTTKAIQTTTKIGTITFTAIAPTTNDPTVITFGNTTSVLSIGATDFATENTLSTALPAYVKIIGSITANNSTKLTLTTYLHSIGTSGDNTNPNDSRLSNKSPQHPNRPVDVYIYNTQNQLISSNSGEITYDPTKGNFTGTVNIDNNILSQGSYTIKIQSPSYLRRLVPGIQTLTPLQENKLPEVTLIAGDIINDNMLDIKDYNILLNCYSDLAPAKSCNDTNKILSDLNDDGSVNQIDYNIFLREISVQTGS